MSISQEIRDAIRAARDAAATRPGDPFREVLDQVAVGLTDESVEARLASGPGGRWTLWLSPAYRPGKATPVLTVVIGPSHTEVLLQPNQSAANPEELAEILKRFVTTPDFLESLAAIAEVANQPVEGFLRVVPRSVSRDDLMVEVSPDQQKDIAGKLGQDITLSLRISDFPGAGTFKPDAAYKVLEAAGFSVSLSSVTRHDKGELRLIGHVARTVSP
jgi:hypothetical protein